jgi:hypothetical protein
MPVGWLRESRSGKNRADIIIVSKTPNDCTESAKNQIVQQAATAMLAQANQQPQFVLKLLENF